MSNDKGPKKDTGINDPRTIWILKRVGTIVGIRRDKTDSLLQKFFANEDGSPKNLQRFLDGQGEESPPPRTIFFYPDAKGSENCIATLDIPGTDRLRRKVVAAVRGYGQTDLSKENIAENVFFMELSGSVLDMLNTYCHSLFISLLMNPANQQGWSDLVQKELMDKFHAYLASLHVTAGLMRGQTLLPLPPKEAVQDSQHRANAAAGANQQAAAHAVLPGIGFGGGSAGSKDRVHVLEGTVITWTKQVRHVLKQEPESVFREGRHPEPLAELQFWKSRADNLNAIHSQLQMDGVKRVLKFLETNKSTYITPFSHLQKEVEDAREEANDNVRFLSTLEPHFKKLMDPAADFEELHELFDGIFHVVLLIWRYSKYYNTLVRLAVLVRQICNSVINQARNYISGSAIFQMIGNGEALECYGMLEKAYAGCDKLRRCYAKFQQIADDQRVGSSWRMMKASLVFPRLDAFMDRCTDVLDFAKTVIQFSKLDRVDIGGTKGRLLSQSVLKIHEEFEEAVHHFRSVPYDIMDVGETKFDDDYCEFRMAAKGLDRRLGSAWLSGFDDLDTIQGRIKLFNAFEGLLERPILQAELEKKQQALVAQYQADIADVQTHFEQHKAAVDSCTEDAPIYCNLPPVAGGIYWVRSLLSRLRDPMPKIVYFNNLSREVPEGFDRVQSMFHHVSQKLEAYERQRYEAWIVDSVEAAKQKLTMRLLRRSERSGLLKVNFDPALVRLLREVHFFLILEGLEVPEAAREMFSQADAYRRWTSQLDHIVELYNSVLTNLLPVEEPLLEERIVKMDMALAPGLTDLRWKSEDRIPEFIEQAMKVVSDVSGIVDIMKGNLRQICNILSSWCKESMLERKRGAKPLTPEEFDLAHTERVGRRVMFMTDGGKDIHRFLKDSSESLKISKSSAPWRAYVDFVNNVIIEGLVSAIAVSLQYVCEILDPLIIARHEMLPVFEVKIELSGQEICFDPPFSMEGHQSKVSLRGTVDGWLKDFFSTATVLYRLDTQLGDYLNEVKEHFQMQCLLSLVSELVDNTEMKCMEYRESFMKYSFLWMDSLDEAFESFLQDNPKGIVQDFEEEGMAFPAIMERVGVNLGRPLPDLSRFDQQIARFSQMKQELSALRTPTDIHWLRIDVQPVKITLVKFAQKWEEKFTDFLKQSVEDRISSLSSFINKVKLGLAPGVGGHLQEGGRTLYNTMTHIRDVKLAMNAVKELFTPIRNQVLLLKQHRVLISDTSLNTLEVIPAQWQEVVRAAFNEKEKILPLQSQEMAKIRTKIEIFREDVQAFRAEFLEQCPFGAENAINWEFERSYAVLDAYQESTAAIRARADKFNDLELLFDMAMSDYQPLRECVEDLRLLRLLWDQTLLVRKTFSDWHSVKWDNIDTEGMMQNVKDLDQQVRAMPKGLKSWPLYTWLLDEVKNMRTALPLVNDLHSETMRDRHWKALMAVTKYFEKGPEFCFRDLLDLELHHYAEDINEIVDQSGKETKIEKKLKNISSIWQHMKLSFDCTREDCPLLMDLTEVMERLDSDSLEMMSMTSQPRIIEFCKREVDEWSEKLRTVDTVLNIWRKFQTNWCRLEPIFMQSDDIRSQLPEDSKQFEGLDNQWKELMMEVSQSSGVVEICCAEGREDTLVHISGVMERCERSLNEYLEQKKKAFPRFYFVANQALLDILSNGNIPLKVAEYLGDVFDGVKTLDFVEGTNGRVARGHKGKCGEEIAWETSCQLEGPVETYLATVEHHIRQMLREILETAKLTADHWDVEKAREVWLEDYCAQLALLASQIQWTEETARTFEEMEAGSETAMRDSLRVNDDRIKRLITRVQGPLDANLRNKIITVITIDVHSRDVIESFVTQRVGEATDFKWVSQLRFHWLNAPTGDDLVSFTSPSLKTCVIKICDWTTVYLYEYVGNIGRLVITPLTDRCYITLTQALNLNLGGAPAGPAGTGKTETTKDLARALGLPIVVYNCSDQMNYQTMAQIFMGLAQVGAWGCFDEFNRISIEVLSVVSSQYKSVLDAIRSRAKTFLFMDEDIRLIRTVGAFITMNPGYAGRTELPENLKALFRSVAMVVPDLRFICENMLMSEGFIIARPLAFKFVTLYSLCKELLSKQMHYDWGLRAVKSLLRQAGTLKRKEPDANENLVLCRALRDFNIPKITTLDMPIFLRLIRDLFPEHDPLPFEDPAFEKVCLQVVKAGGLQADPGFISKIVSLLDILQVRHCCFIIGPTGCAKTESWRGLMEALKLIGQDGMWEQVNPKALTSDELYGTMSKSKEWKDGAIAVIMRNMSKEMNGYKASHLHKWVVLDGDIDATWIESMNTVMDDNKVLTLVSNERIPFTPTMRMLLEIQDMKHASPATVSRGGVLFINESDVGWKPYVESWREKLDPVAQSVFYLLFMNQFEGNIEHIRKACELSCPILDIGFVQSLTCLLDALLNSNTKENMEAMRTMSSDDAKATYEAFFTYAMMWAIGGAIADDKNCNHRKPFNSFIKDNARGPKIPDGGECWDYRYEPHLKEWVHWSRFVTEYNPVAEKMYQNIIVSTVEIERLKFLLDLHVHHKKPVLFVGVAGTGKTTIVKDYLHEVKVSNDAMGSVSINLNSYTTSGALQSIIMGPLEKRSGRSYGPPGHRKCMFFVDDLNMPHVDMYDTQSAIMLLCQIFSYGQVYDRNHLDEKRDLVDLLFTSCMNPKAGSFMINGRLQRHFTVLTTYTPTQTVISGIFQPILTKHLSTFSGSISRLTESIMSATTDILVPLQTLPSFLPSAEKFHYQFNLKDISNIFQGLCSTTSGMYTERPVKFLRAWLHEVYRTFSDRLIKASDSAELQTIVEKVVSRHFVGTSKEDLFSPPLVMTSFVSQAKGHEKFYLPVKDMTEIRDVLESQLAEYNNEFAAMNLVLFDDAVFHVCRISRITDNPCGHALLVGVGGSGKQSLARLASYINRQDIVSILVNQSYGLVELRTDLQEFYKRAAVKPATPQAFLMNDGQIVDEEFLVFINDLLASAIIPDLFAREEYDDIFNNIRSAAKHARVDVDDREAVFEFFVDTVRRNLHVILCHSPVGSAFRVRGRMFPALISCMSLDVFHPWPRAALDGVAKRFLVQLVDELNLGEDVLSLISAHVSEVHLSINAANKRYLDEERRYNSTTPKSFLEFVSFYISMLTDKQHKVKFNIERLERGLGIMKKVQQKVATLRTDLQDTIAMVEDKKAATEVLIEQVTEASAGAEEEKLAANVESENCERLAAEAQKIQDQAEQEMKEAMPAMEEAQKAIDCLDKSSIQELKNLPKPPFECVDVGAACGFLLRHEKRKLDWKGCVKMMNNPTTFLDDVKNFDAHEIPDKVLENTDQLIAKPFFNFETMKTKSFAAACLANWVVNIVTYHKIYKKVEPLMRRVDAAKESTAKAEAELDVVRKHVAEVEAACAALDDKLRQAVEDKEAVELQARQCTLKLALAERLVDGLADENERWTGTVADLKDLGVKLIGNCLLASAFVGYISPFSSRLRKSLSDTWSKDLIAKGLPMTANVDALKVLATDADIAGWQNEGLPADRVSTENASVLVSCSRWPLMIDPQQQGLRWIKQRIGEDLVVIQFSNPTWLQQVSLCVKDGRQLLIEAVGEEIDAVLGPVLARAVIKKGRQLFLKLSGEFIDYNPKFQLYLQSKLPNPHYRPEIAAQCTIINFIVTPDGLEEQILARVVNVEKPELEQQKQELVRKQNEYKVILSQLEEGLLGTLSAADPTTILENLPLIEALEKTKATAKDITLQVQSAQATELEINHSRELYRVVAAEGSVLFFLVNQLCIVEHMYQYSLDSFLTFLDKAIERTALAEEIAERIGRLTSSIRLTIFRWVNRGLFEEHKLIFCTMLTLRLFQLGKLGDHEKFNAAYYNFLLRGPSMSDCENPLRDWLPNKAWCMALKLTELEDFELFAQHLEKDAPNRFKEWFNDPAPEGSKLPLDWKRLENTFQKLLVIRCLRPDRMAMALSNWIRHAMPNGTGSEYMDCDASLSFYEVLYSAHEDSTSATPFFFILSPGADPVKEVEALGRKLIQLQANVNYHNVAMGQGQDVVAMAKLDLGHKEGHWVMLQNVHLMPAWCVELEKRLNSFEAEGSHPNFRLFLSADPAKGIPIGVLERSIKLTNEPPQGLQANLRRSFALFQKDDFEERDSKIKAILFGLCHFHSLMLERKKFGALGFNMKYPFSAGDLRDSASVLYNYLEGSTSVKIPWEDLRYIFGEIMYGGHIVDDWDRKTCSNYLQYFMQDDLLDEQEMVPYADHSRLSWKTPGPSPHDKYLEHIDNMPPESPLFFGMHPNAEIGFRTEQCRRIFELLHTLQPKEGGPEEGDGGTSPMTHAEELCDEILSDVRDIKYMTEDIARNLTDDDKGPYQFVFLQECDAMNALAYEMVRGLNELQLGFKGELTTTEQMEQLAEALYNETLPLWWVKLGFPSTRPLRSWLANLKDRCAQLDDWVAEPLNIPKVVDISKFFSPQSFLTAIKQLCCQVNKLELDKLQVFTEVTKRDVKQVDQPAREGAFVTGMYLEGARWDMNTNSLEDSKPKETFTRMPVINCKAGPQLDRDDKNLYTCPTYCVPTRRPYFVFAAQLRTKHPPAKWVLAGVALILDIGFT